MSLLFEKAADLQLPRLRHVVRMLYCLCTDSVGHRSAFIQRRTINAIHRQKNNDKRLLKSKCVANNILCVTVWNCNSRFIPQNVSLFLQSFSLLRVYSSYICSGAGHLKVFLDVIKSSLYHCQGFIVIYKTLSLIRSLQC